jgi:ribosomal protein L3 glutamine methyltransferase
MRLPHDAPARALQRKVGAAQVARVTELLERRIAERVPLPYLTHEAWFAGLRFYVDERVLIPRSPFAELLERRFAPWIEPRRVARILDLGTGSGCIALAAAKAFPRARVDAVDIDTGALEVAAINRRRLRLTRRVRLIESDHFAALSGESYDIIASNPPYVGTREMRGLPREYRHEPRVALESGREGLDSVGSSCITRRDTCARGGCWWSRWATPSACCSVRIRACLSRGWISNAAAAGCSC